MKIRILSQVFLLLILGNFVMLAASDPLHPLMETHKPTVDEIKKFQKEDARRVNTIPIKELPIGYLIVGNAALAPAFLNQYSFKAYQWKDVFVKPSDIPGLAGESNVSTSRINPIDPKRDGFTVEEIDPPIHCLNLGSGKYAVGYFDDSCGLFFRWGDLEFSRDQLPVGSESLELFLKPGSFSTVRISPPRQYELKEPNHVSAKTTLAPITSERKASSVVPGVQNLSTQVEKGVVSHNLWMMALVIVLIAGTLRLFLYRKK